MLSDREIAIRILAIEEGEIDPTQDLQMFNERFDVWGATEHSGDCRKQPWTCVRCVHDDVMKRVPGVRALFAE